MTGYLDAPRLPVPVVITEDRGGLVSKYKMATERYVLENRRVVIDGSCRSACVLALGARNVCVTPNAVVKFHAAYNSITGEERPDVTREMVNSLSLKIQSSVNGKIGREYSPGATLGYSRLVELGISPCSETIVSRTITPKKRNNVGPLFHKLTSVIGIFGYVLGQLF